MKTVEDYLNTLPDERKIVLQKLRELAHNHLPKGFQEELNYGMIGFVVPHSIYPKGYHVNSEMPLPFLNIASQKNHIGIYHMGIYAYPNLLKWFQEEYPKHMKTKLDMGKSCIRFKNTKTIPYNLLAELFEKMTVEEWISIYEQQMSINP